MPRGYLIYYLYLKSDIIILIYSRVPIWLYVKQFLIEL